MRHSVGAIVIQIQTVGSSSSTPTGSVLWTLGFRPFFLGAAALVLLLMAGWLAALAGGFSPSAYYGARLWHGHEMLFGYTVAVISGFLLTAIRNWAEVPTPTGKTLMALVGLWLAGRLLGVADQVPGWLVATVDLFFLPTLLISLALPLGRAGKLATPHSLVNMTALALLSVANLLIHLDRLEITVHTATTGLNMALGVVILLLGAVGGRVIPMFISRQFPGKYATSRLARLGLPSLGALLVAETVALPAAIIGILAALAALGNAARLWDWCRPCLGHEPSLWHKSNPSHGAGLWRQPMLWVLVTGYGWLVIGLTLKAFAQWHMLPISVATHALTAGAVGVLTIGMMSRVSLGHSGRPMVPHPLVITGFVLMNLAVLIRVVGPLLAPAAFTPVMMLAGGLWLITFGLFLWVYTPILIFSPETDD